LQILFNPEQVAATEAATYKNRHAARAVLADPEGRIALLHVQKLGFYKLPGGGLEDGETPSAALVRECLEETGCRITLNEPFATVEEWRKLHQLRQYSSCFLAHTDGHKGEPAFDQGESALDFKLIWLEPTRALQMLQSCQPQDTEGKLYIVPRDIWILQNALALTAKPI
jgi:8-oxo-dGTP diphosphatase